MDANSPHQDWSVKEVFTTGEAAELCRVSQQTIIRCFDSGRLTGFKVPGSKFRRIPRDELIRFMRANNIPTESLSGGPRVRILVVAADPRMHELARAVISQDGMIKDRSDVMTVATALDAGIEIGTGAPGVVFLGSDVPGLDLIAAVRRLASLDHRPSVVCFAPQGNDAVGAALRTAGASDVVATQNGRDTLAAAILGAVRSKLSENGQ